MLPKFMVFYNAHGGTMYPVQSIITKPDGSTVVKVIDHPDYWNPIPVSGKWKVGELLQFTEVSDKYGKEIYDGHIVEKRYYGLLSIRKSEICGIVKYGTFSILAELGSIEISVTGWYVELSDGSGKIPLTNEFEIIGHCFENKELLTKEEREYVYNRLSDYSTENGVVK